MSNGKNRRLLPEAESHRDFPSSARTRASSFARRVSTAAADFSAAARRFSAAARRDSIVADCGTGALAFVVRGKTRC